MYKYAKIFVKFPAGSLAEILQFSLSHDLPALGVAAGRVKTHGQISGVYILLIFQVHKIVAEKQFHIDDPIVSRPKTAQAKAASQRIEYASGLLPVTAFSVDSVTDTPAGP